MALLTNIRRGLTVAAMAVLLMFAALSVVVDVPGAHAVCSSSIGEACTQATVGSCCAPLVCSAKSLCVNPKTCRRLGKACTQDGDCCRDRVCSGSICVAPGDTSCIKDGQPCNVNSDCCGLSKCNEPSAWSFSTEKTCGPA